MIAMMSLFFQRNRRCVFLFLILFALSWFFSWHYSRWAYWRVEKKRTVSNKLLAFFLIAQALGVFHVFSLSISQWIPPHLFFIGLPFQYLWGVTLYLYVKSITQSEFKLKISDLLHLIPSLIIVGHLFPTFFLHSAEFKRQIIISRHFFYFTRFYILFYALHVQICIYVSLSFFQLYRLHEKIKMNALSNTRTNLKWTEIFLFGYLFGWLFNLLVSLFASSLPSFILTFRKEIILINFLIFFNLIYYKGFNQPEIFISPQIRTKYLKSTLSDIQFNQKLSALQSYMKTDKPYLKPTLTIQDLAKALSISPSHLSQIINATYHQNFLILQTAIALQKWNAWCKMIWTNRKPFSNCFMKPDSTRRLPSIVLLKNRPAFHRPSTDNHYNSDSKHPPPEAMAFRIPAKRGV